MVEITAVRLERIFQPMRALKFITDHVVYKPSLLSKFTRFWLQTTPLTPQPTSPVPKALFILDSSSHESLSHCKIIGLDVIFHCNSLEYQTSTKHRYLVKFSMHFNKNIPRQNDDISSHFLESRLRLRIRLWS